MTREKNSYYWYLCKILEFYICVMQKDRPQVELTNKKDTLIAGLKDVMLASHHTLSNWQVNNNILGKVIKLFSTTKLVKY